MQKDLYDQRVFSSPVFVSTYGKGNTRIELQRESEPTSLSRVLTLENQLSLLEKKTDPSKKMMENIIVELLDLFLKNNDGKN